MRNGPRATFEDLAPDVAGALLARLGDLWLVASGQGLLLLDVAAGDAADRHSRVVEAADRLRRELFDLLTVAPFIEPLVVVGDDAAPAPAEVPADLVRHLVAVDAADPMVTRVRALIDAGLLS